MKTIKNLALLGAIALTGATVLTACSSNDETSADVNPTFDGSTVRTDFAFSVAKGTTTRMSGTNTQENGGFRGMSDMYLFPFNGEPAASKTTNANIFSLGSLTNTEISNDQSSRVYALTLPIGTDNFLFYGLAAKSGETNFQVGKVTSSLTATTASTDGINFQLTPIAASGLGDDATKIAAYLTAIAGATGWAGTVSTAATDGNYRALAQLYTNFTTVPTGEARSGSAESVVRMVLDLYKSAKAINKESGTEAVKTIAGAIVTAINTEVSGVKVAVTDTDADAANWTAAASGFDAAFPSNLGLPMGAAQLKFESGAFAYNNPFALADDNSDRNFSINIADINYPAELIYFDNSPLRASDTYHAAADFPVTTANWDAALGSTGGFSSDWTGTSVSSSTRAVAMQNNVNYGVALLETSVKLEANNLTDNKAALLGATAENQTDIDGTKFKVTGLLIGGQPGEVKWDMTNPDASFSKVIYDNDITFKETALSTTGTGSNYTIVFDNYTSGANQKDVLFALQLVNGDKDFYGKHNLIPAGSTFYLVGKLSLDGKSFTAATRNASYRITQETEKRVFIQDYRTKANITLSANALQEAYSTIPDLVSTETVFGLSVDLKWESGLEFDVNM